MLTHNRSGVQTGLDCDDEYLMLPSRKFDGFQFTNTYEPQHENSNNVVCATTKGSDQPVHTLEYSMSVTLLTEHHLEFLSLMGGCTGSSESTLVKMPHCWKSHAAKM